MAELDQQTTEQQQDSQPKDSKRRDWVVVINNPTQTEQEFYEYIQTLSNIKYACFGKEQGEQGTIHFQCYFEFSETTRFSKMKKDFPTAHIEPRGGTKTECRDYVFKIGKYADKANTRISEIYEFGKFVDNGERSDLNEIMDDIEQGMSDIELSRKHQGKYARHQKWADRYKQDFLIEKYGKQRRLDLETVYIYGSPDSGKTRYIMDTYGDENVYRITDYDGLLFDNYDSESIVVFEEFRSQVQIEKMLNYLDIYPLKLRARYNNKQACYTKVFIVTNWNLNEQYPNIQKDHPTTWQAFLKRIHKVFDFDNNTEKPIRFPSEEIKKMTELRQRNNAEQIKMGLIPVNQDELPF